MIRHDGFYGMGCWNGLSTEQQERLVSVGNLPLGWQPMGGCNRPADCSIETADDRAPGPRFYCYECARDYLKHLDSVNREERRRRARRVTEGLDSPAVTTYPVTKW